MRRVFIIFLHSTVNCVPISEGFTKKPTLESKCPLNLRFLGKACITFLFAILLSIITSWSLNKKKIVAGKFQYFNSF